MIRRPPRSPLFPSPPLSRSNDGQPPLEPRPRRADRRAQRGLEDRVLVEPRRAHRRHVFVGAAIRMTRDGVEDRKSTRLNSSHGYISYAVFCLKKKKQDNRSTHSRLQHSHFYSPYTNTHRRNSLMHHASSA